MPETIASVSVKSTAPSKSIAQLTGKKVFILGIGILKWKETVLADYVRTKVVSDLQNRTKETFSCACLWSIHNITAMFNSSFVLWKLNYAIVLIMSLTLTCWECTVTYSGVSCRRLSTPLSSRTVPLSLRCWASFRLLFFEFLQSGPKNVSTLY